VTLPDHPGAHVGWRERDPGEAPGDLLVDAISAVELADGIQAWVAGEAAAMQRIRRLLLEDRGLARAQMSVRGYWKRGRSGLTMP
jgi:NADPH-dependent ferric siderophore reductase